MIGEPPQARARWPYGDAGRFANADNLLSQSPRFLIDREPAVAVITAMKDRIRTGWYELARAEGVSEHDCQMIAGAFVYPGFRSRT